MRVSIVTTTYRRRKDIQRLLGSIYHQKVQPDEVLVIVGPGDKEGLEIAQTWQIKISVLRVLQAQKTSLVHAINMALSMVKGDIICHLDDDVWIPQDYILKIKRAYESNLNLGAYGGRDHLQLTNSRLANPPLARLVGTYRWFGRFVGNHHCGAQKSPVQVDSLKGVNLSFRRVAFPAMQIEPALEGKGAEAGWEVDVSQRVKQAGFQVVYDNDNYVLHYASPRLDFDDRTDIFSPAIPARVFNDSLIVAKFRPPIEIFASFVSDFLLGSRAKPGLIWSMLLIPKYGWKIIMWPWRMVSYMWQGTIRGLELRQGVASREGSKRLQRANV